jgi:hypothetical protein
MRTTQDVLERVRGEYLQMPGLSLTVQEAQRLCGIEQTLCKTVLDSMVSTRFLCVTPDGTYARLADGEIPRPRPRRQTSPQESPSRPLRDSKSRNGMKNLTFTRANSRHSQ